jgi:hypothetical protein
MARKWPVATGIRARPRLSAAPTQQLAATPGRAESYAGSAAGGDQACRERCAGDEPAQPSGWTVMLPGVANELGGRATAQPGMKPQTGDTSWALTEGQWQC